VTLLWSPGNIPNSGFSLFHCSTHKSSSPSLNSCHIPPFDAQNHLWVKEHHLNLGFFYFCSAITQAVIFLFSIVAFIVVVKDHSTRGIRQSDIRRAPKTRNVVPVKVLNPPRVETQPLNRSLGQHPFQVCTGTSASFFILSGISLITFPYH
jgi:hypothetical protein